MQAELKEEEKLKLQVKIGDIVQFADHQLPMFLGKTGIVLEFFHEGFDALVLLNDGGLFLDRVEAFVVL